MAHRAFVLGCNGVPGKARLQWAERDAERIEHALRSPRGSYVVTHPREVDEKWARVAQLERAIGGCGPRDTFVFYFAGHGLLERGKLHLVWQAEGKDELEASIPVSVVLDLVQRCTAASKLVILDCCHAGAVDAVRGVEAPVEEVTTPQPDNYLLLMGSKRVQTVREFADYQGTFLGARLSAALGDQFDAADRDGDRQLSFSDLMDWLSASWEALPPERRDQVPAPYFFGRRSGELFLTPRHAAWVPAALAWPNDTSMIVLPVRPREGRALCMARHAVSNAQYRAFRKQTRHPEPAGRHFPGVGDRFDLGTWRAGFKPWRDERFNAPAQPVVCVELADAMAYRRWLQAAVQAMDFRAAVFLPPPLLWKLAAYGAEREPETAREWIGDAALVHQKGTCPLANDESGERQNSLGLSDMIGNVWEWCPFVETGTTRGYAASGYSAIYSAERTQRDTLRGGGFLDDLTRTRPFLETWRTGGSKTRHFDVGLRVAGWIDCGALDVDVRAALALQRDATPEAWAEVAEAAKP